MTIRGALIFLLALLLMLIGISALVALNMPLWFIAANAIAWASLLTYVAISGLS